MKASDDKEKSSSAKKKRIRILIADDHSVVREGLASLVKRKSDMVVVAEASNGREAVEHWKKHRPDVTLLDLRMPELDGVGAIKEIRQLDENVRRVHAGETYLPPQLAAKLAERVSGEALSPREVEVLQGMAVGKSNKEIGAELFISEGTVKTHIKSIFSKLDVVSRTEAVATATRRGLIRL
jgi:DNA-binding NarL/FixJ family response regulator